MRVANLAFDNAMDVKNALSGDGGRKVYAAVCIVKGEKLHSYTTEFCMWLKSRMEKLSKSEVMNRNSSAGVLAADEDKQDPGALPSSPDFFTSIEPADFSKGSTLFTTYYLILRDLFMMHPERSCSEIHFS